MKQKDNQQRRGQGLRATLLFAVLAVFLTGTLIAGTAGEAYGAIAQFEITATSANTAYGTVSGGGLLTTEDTAVLTATPNAGYRFVDWKEGNPAVTASTDAVYSFPVTQARTLTATFAAIGTPTLTGAASAGYDSVKVTWTAVAGATFYDVYKATSATGTYTKAGTGSGTSLVVSGLTTGKTYYFKVKAGVFDGTNTTVGKSYSAYKSAKPVPSTPSITAASASYTSIKVSWPAVKGATGYYVYRATSSTGTYSYIGSTTGTSYTNGSRITGKTYYYKVKAYRTVNGVKVFGNLSSYKYAKAVPAAPASVGVSTVVSTKAKVTWSGVSGATKYLVYRSTSQTSGYTLVYTASSSARSWTNTGLANGKTYYFKVRAYHLEGTTKVYGNYSSPKTHVQGAVYPAGTYKVGVDIPAGEYLINPTNTSLGLYYTSTDGNFDNYIYGDFLSFNAYITLTSGQYLTIEYGKAYPVSFAGTPLVPLDADGNLKRGMYKVGRDIPAGTYVLFNDPDEGDALMETFRDSKYGEDSLVGFEFFQGRCPVTLTAGQYLYFDGGVGYALADAPAVVPVNGCLPEGMYKVGPGEDLLAGTYTLIPNGTEEAEYAYYFIYSDDSHSYTAILWEEDVPGPTQVTLQAGEYLYLYACKVQLP